MQIVRWWNEYWCVWGNKLAKSCILLLSGVSICFLRYGYRFLLHFNQITLQIDQPKSEVALFLCQKINIDSIASKLQTKYVINIINTVLHCEIVSKPKTLNIV